MQIEPENINHVMVARRHCSGWKVEKRQIMAGASFI